MAIGPIGQSAFPDSIRSVELVPGGQESTPIDGAQTPSFSEELNKAVSAVDQLQVQADAEAMKVANGQGNLHETALALEKADVSMRVAMKVRNKLVDAYQEVMRMNI